MDTPRCRGVGKGWSEGWKGIKSTVLVEFENQYKLPARAV
jgi:hypothetical protein